MSISCKCSNIVVTLVGSDTESHPRFDLDAYLSRQKRPQQESATATAATRATTPSDDHFLFFKEALGPVQCSAIEIQFEGLLERHLRIFDEWDLIQCRNCACCVYARNVTDTTTTTSTTTCLVNATLITNPEQRIALKANKNYSPAFGILLDPSTLTYSDLAERNKLLGKAKNDTRFVNMLRAYMERETEASNERIHRFTEQEFAGLKVKRERAEQDCHILTKLARNVPELSNSSSNNNKSSEISVRQSTTKTSIQADSISPMGPPGPKPNRTINLNDSSGSQLETPPPTPEYLPMSTSNSPPMSAASNAHGRRQTTTTPSSSSSMSAADQSSSSSPVARLVAGARNQPRANTSSSNGSNNNNIVSFSNTQGAITSRQPPTTAAAHQHSSTNAIMMQRMAQSSFESECMFDIDGMENDKSPPSNTLSDEEELGFDESISNNNDDGMYIPPRQYGRQISSIAKSLPISMPQAMAQFRTNEEDFDELTEDNVDIAASIKALAKSVHGDTVFGDLPRPQIQRFSTQI